MKYMILELSNDNIGADSSWWADTDGILYNTLIEAQRVMREKAIEQITFLNNNSGEDVLYTMGNVEDDELTEIEVWREDDNGRGIYLPTGLLTRYSIKGVA